MKKCSFCGALNPDTEIFCSSCGGPLENAEYVQNEDPKTSSKNDPEKSAGTDHSAPSDNARKKVTPQTAKAFLLGMLAVCAIGLIILIPRTFHPSGDHSTPKESPSSTPKTVSGSTSDSKNEAEAFDSSSETNETHTYDDSLETTSPSDNTADMDKIYPGYVDLERDKEISVDLSGNGISDTFYYTAILGVKDEIKGNFGEKNYYEGFFAILRKQYYNHTNQESHIIYINKELLQLLLKILEILF